MAKTKVYGFCQAGCKREVVAKEDIPCKFVYLTQAEYDQLTEYDGDTLYCITDGQIATQAICDTNTTATVNNIKREGNYVIFNFEGTNSSNAVYLTIPEGFRPKEQITIYASNGGSILTIYVEPTGVIWNSATSETDLYILLTGGSSLKILNVGWEIA
jgi:hypothetical protein